MKSITLAQMRTILLDNRPHDFGIVLNGGIISRKTIRLMKNGLYEIHNHVDETFQHLDSDDIQNDALTNIGRAAKKSALIQLD